MSIPPLLSRSPPPICEISDEDDETYGNYVVSTELAVDVLHGGDILGDFDRKTKVNKYEDTTSEDSGLCMSTAGQNQSPCETSPVSSTYIPSVGFETQHNCEKSASTCPSFDPDQCGKNFLKQSLCIQDNKNCDEYIPGRINSEVDFEKVGSHGEMKTRCKIPPLPLTSSENLTTLKTTLESFKISNDIPFNTSVESCGGIESISQNTLNTIDCDEDRFLEKIDIVEAESIDFSDFQMFQVAEKHECSETEIKAINSSNIKLQNFTQNSTEDKENDCINPFCDGIPSTPSNINSKGENEEKTFSLQIEDNEGEEINLLVDSLSLDNIGNQNINLISTEQQDCTDSHQSFYEAVDSFNDDEFSDFVDFQSSADVVNINKNLNVPLQTSIQESWSGWWPDCSVPSVLTIALSSELERNGIWQNLKHLDTSPALMYQWSSSVSNCKLLSALNIDSRNILLGPWNRNRFSATEEFPSNIVKKTIPGEKSELIDDTTILKDPVPDPHFDWVGSGLVNPLDSSHDRREKFAHDTLKTVPHPSQLAEEILQNLPNLSFMRKSFIVFPKCVT